jgi:hypothetical protein
LEWPTGARTPGGFRLGLQVGRARDHPLKQVVTKCDSVVVLGVAGGVQQEHVTDARGVEEWPPRFPGPVEFARVPAPEFFPPARIVTEPATQLITGSGISRPTGKGEGGLGYPPRPDPVDEPTGSRILIAELVDADRSDHGSIQPKSLATALPPRDERWWR